VNAKRIYRLYREEGLLVRTKQRKKIARRQRIPAAIASRPNQCWSIDFVSEKLSDGRSFRILTGVDQFTRECVLLVAERSMSGEKVIEALNQAILDRVRNPRALPAITAASSRGGRWKPGP
jgi:putative transposase